MKKLSQVSIAAVAAAAFVLVGGVSAAHADAVGGRSCPGGAQAVGTYYSAGGARTTEILDCSSVQVRIAYKTYPGSPTYLTGWTTNATNAYQPNPGGQIYSNHRGTAQPANTWFTLP